MKKRNLVVLLVILVLAILVFALFKDNLEEVKIEKHIIEIQYELEQKLLEEYNNGEYTFENPYFKLDPYNASPLSLLVAFKTSEKQTVTVEVLGKSTETTIVYTFPENTEHFLPIYGLYPDYENTIVLTLENGDTNTLTVKTHKLPEDFILPTKVTKNKIIDNKLFFVSPASEGYMAAYDTNGDVRWYLTNMHVWDIQRLKNGRLLVGSDRFLNPPYYVTGLVEIDLFGKVYKEYNLPGGYHHDVFEMENGNLLVASNLFERGTVEDYIVEIERETGNIIKSWDVGLVLPMEDSKSENWVVYDWFHNNSVWYDKKTNSIILSGRHQDAVISIDYDTNNLNWIIGDNTNWSEEMQKYFFTPKTTPFDWQWSQHAAMVLPNGDIFILDNGNNRSKIKEEYISADDNYTRGVIYRIDTENMTIEEVWQYGKERGSDFYSPYISDVDYLGENHYLVHSGGIGKKDGKALNIPATLDPEAEKNSITVEVLNDEVIFEIQLPSNFYRAEKLNLYNAEFNFALGKGEQLGTLGETKTVDEKIKIPYFESGLIPKKYELKLTKEIDRLRIETTFKKDQVVYVILTGENKTLIYNIPTVKLPYTAMCIGSFIDNDPSDIVNSTFFINDETLSGKYEISFLIDGKKYSTNKVTNFK